MRNQIPKIRFSTPNFFKNILSHPNITVKLSIDALEHITKCDEPNLLLVDGDDDFQIIFTGALDELFDCCYGKLPYRSLRFEWKYEEKESFQEAPLVAYPQVDGYTRIVEYKKLPPQNVKGTSYAIEYPLPYKQNENNEPYYPVLTEESQKLYSKYKALSLKYSNLIPCGRLADFKYYNMDQALQRALNSVKTINK